MQLTKQQTVRYATISFTVALVYTIALSLLALAKAEGLPIGWLIGYVILLPFFGFSFAVTKRKHYFSYPAPGRFKLMEADVLILLVGIFSVIFLYPGNTAILALFPGSILFFVAGKLTGRYLDIKFSQKKPSS